MLRKYYWSSEKCIFYNILRENFTDIEIPYVRSYELIFKL